MFYCAGQQELERCHNSVPRLPALNAWLQKWPQSVLRATCFFMLKILSIMYEWTALNSSRDLQPISRSGADTEEGAVLPGPDNPFQAVLAEQAVLAHQTLTQTYITLKRQDRLCNVYSIATYVPRLAFHVKTVWSAHQRRRGSQSGGCRDNDRDDHKNSNW